MTPQKLTIPLQMGLTRAHLVIRLRFSDFFVVLINDDQTVNLFGKHLIFMDGTTYQTIQSGQDLCANWNSLVYNLSTI